MNISTKTFEGVKYYLPANEEEISYLVNLAIEEKKVVCLRGAAHSIPLVRSLEREKNRLYIYLGRMRAVNIDSENRVVRVQGGCNLGFDPSDPSGISTLENSLTYQLHMAGFALPDLSGITHQTVGGFLSTGAAGSSMKTPFNDYLQSITMITAKNGKATRVTFVRDNNYETNEFFAAGLSLGMFGVIVEATFRLRERFVIEGQEETLSVDKWPVDFFGDTPGKQPLNDFFREHDFQRILWWPQKGLNKLQIWTAREVAVPEDYTPIPYAQLTGNFLGLPIQLYGRWLFNFFGRMSWALHRWILFRKTMLGGWVASFFRKVIVPKSLGLLVTDSVVPFKDDWYQGLPMDNCIDERLIPVWLSELWFPMENAPEIIREFRDYFEKRHDGPGTFGYEIYPSRGTEFWISPGYKRNALRVDLFWFAGNPEDPIRDFYQEFWEQLSYTNFRSHWGKFLPEFPQEKLHKMYPKLNDWMAVREKYDPVGVFLNDYWRTRLHIQ